jgi:hypothetical protein
MAITTLVPSRVRTEVKTFTDTVLADLEALYAAYESGKAGDDTKTWSVRVVTSYWDGANYILVAEAQYPELSDTGAVPEGGS